MGIFNSLVQLSGGDFSSAMNPTGGGVFTPSNPGNLDTIRTAPIVPNTREFSPVEAAASLIESRRKSDKRLEVIEARTRQILKGVY